MTDLEAAVSALQARVQHLDDQAAIYQLIANYGPAADSGWSEMAASLWTEDGIYDAQVGAWQGRPAIAGMIDGDTHQGYIHAGCAHVLTMPYITIDGDIGGGDVLRATVSQRRRELPHLASHGHAMGTAP